MSETPYLRTDEELRKMALDYINGKVFTSFDIRPGERESITTSVFLPLVFMSEDDRQSMIEEKIVMFYEYFNKAGGRSVNGYPTFFSCHIMNEEDQKKWAEYVGEVWEFQKQFVRQEAESE